MGRTLFWRIKRWRIVGRRRIVGWRRILVGRTGVGIPDLDAIRRVKDGPAMDQPPWTICPWTTWRVGSWPEGGACAAKAAAAAAAHIEIARMGFLRELISEILLIGLANKTWRIDSANKTWRTRPGEQDLANKT
jgi:hypothetical protein